MLDFVVNQVPQENVCNSDIYQFLADDTSNLRQHSCYRMGLPSTPLPWHDHMFRVTYQQNIVASSNRFDCDDVSSNSGDRSGYWLFYVR